MLIQNGHHIPSTPLPGSWPHELNKQYLGSTHQRADDLAFGLSPSLVRVLTRLSSLPVLNAWEKQGKRKRIGLGSWLYRSESTDTGSMAPGSGKSIRVVGKRPSRDVHSRVAGKRCVRERQREDQGQGVLFKGGAAVAHFSRLPLTSVTSQSNITSQ